MQALIQAALLLALAGAACSSEHTVPASCGQVSTCGGDIVGDWALSGACVGTATLSSFYGLKFQSSCPPEVTATDDFTLDYAPTTVSFNADGTYAGTFAMTGSIRIQIPTACLAATCTDLHDEVRTMVAPGGPTIAASCAGTATSCSCTLTVGRVFHQTGTYTASSGQFVDLQPDEGPVSHYTRYCVTGPELHLVTYLPTTNELDAALAFGGDIVLVKQ